MIRFPRLFRRAVALVGACLLLAVPAAGAREADAGAVGGGLAADRLSADPLVSDGDTAGDSLVSGGDGSLNTAGGDGSSAAGTGTSTRQDTSKYRVFEATLSELQQWMEEGSLTSRELCEVYLERIEVFNQQYNAVVSINERLLEEADALDAERAAGQVRGPLHGIPLVMKDNIDVAGLPTTNGYQSWLDNLADEDAACVQRLKDAGALILGKTNMSTEAQIGYFTYSNAYGETFNAYNLDFSAAGSSGGAAVAVSANLAAAALGTDTGVSVRAPAAVNGLCGLRPTTGLIDRTGVVELNQYRDTVGTLTRKVSDTAVLLDSLVDRDDGGAYTAALDPDGLRGKRIGRLRELCETTSVSPWNASLVSPVATEAFAQALSDMEQAGAVIVDVSYPDLFYDYNRVMADIGAMEDMQETVYALMEQYDLDAFVYPSYLSYPVENGTWVTSEDLISTSVYLAPTVGFPAIVVPMGYTADGVSMGVQFVCGEYAEDTLLAIAYSYEQATGHRVAPAIAPNLYEPEPEPVPTTAPPTTAALPEETRGPTAVVVTLLLGAGAALAVTAGVLLWRQNRARRRHARRRK